MTPVQVRMARAALDLSVEALSQEAGLSPDDLRQLEHGGSEGAASAKLRATFEASGISFLDGNGVTFDESLRDAKTIPLEDMNSYNDE